MAGSVRVYRDDKEKRQGLQQCERRMVCDLGGLLRHRVEHRLPVFSSGVRLSAVEPTIRDF